jgi:phosphoribosylanthranilate isomerase
MTRVKICGLSDVETALAAAEAGADFIGLMFAQSRRKVTPQACYDIVTAIHEKRGKGQASFPGPVRGEVSARSWYGAWNEAIEEALFIHRPLIVGVFADQAVTDVIEIAAAAKLDMVQLSGGEDDSFVRAMTIPAVRVVHVSATDRADDVVDRAPAGIAQAVMLDTAKDGARGGTGTAFDWSVAAVAGESMPTMLGGGLDPENVAEAITVAAPWAVDVSSGVETEGTKDIEKIRAFIRAAKGAGS